MNIFISYNSNDSSLVHEVVERLKGMNNQIRINAKIFLDRDDLIGGQNWVKTLQEALDDCDTGIVFIGEDGIGNWQNKEVLALLNKYDQSKGEFRIIPVIIRDCKTGQLQKNMPWFLADMQWVELEHATDSIALERIVDSIAGQESIYGPISYDVCPYKGLDFFEVKDAPFFFGRTFDTNWIFYKKLQLGLKFGTRFLALVGDSGSGKSSFARAGILANIKAGRFARSRNWKQIIFSPEDNPLLKLSAVLQASAIIEDAKRMEEDALSDGSAFRRALEVYGHRLVVLVDQFEEVITQCKDNCIREAFLKNICEGMKSQYLVCIITLRSDFYAAFSPFREFAELMESSNYTITSLEFNTSGSEWFRYLRNIIQKPARLLNVRVEPILTTQILEDCKTINGVLPALQLALIGLWSKRTDNHYINSADYEMLTNGRGIAGIIESHVNNVCSVLTKGGSDKHAENLIKAIFVRLLEITSNKEDVRKTVNKVALVEELRFQYKQAEVEDMLNRLSGPDVRLVRIKKDGADQNVHWVEVIHEVLIREWEMLRKWVNDRRDAINYKNKLERIIEDDEKVLTGKKLVCAEQWIADHQDLTTLKLNTFVEDCRRRVNKRRNTVMAMSGTFISLVIIIVMLYPVIECSNCTLVNEVVRSNIDENEINSITISDINEIRNLSCFKKLQAVNLQAKTDEDRLSQKDIDLLPRHLTQLSIIGFSTNDTLLKFQAFTNLRSLTLSALEGVRRLDVTNVESMSELNLSGLNEFNSFEEVVGIRSLKNLETLRLEGMYQLLSLKGIEGLKSLKVLALKMLRINELSAVSDLNNLKELELDHLNIGDLQALKSLKQLRELRLVGLPNLGDLRILRHLTENLQSLSLNLHIDSLNDVGFLTNLQELKLQELRVTNLNSLFKLNKLHKLSLSKLENNFTLQGIERFYQLEDLKLLDLQLREFGLLKNLTNLHALEISGIRSLSDLEIVSSLTNLRSLSLADLDINKLSGIQNLNRLRVLNIRNLKISNLSGIDNLNDLESLSLSELRINDLSGISKNLRALHLGYIENVSLGGISNLMNLRALTLSFLTDANLIGIEQLKNMKVLYLDNVSGSRPLSIPKLNPQINLDSLVVLNVKLETLGFLGAGVAVKNLVYNDETVLSSKELKVSVMARDMKRTKFINLTMLRGPFGDKM